MAAPYSDPLEYQLGYSYDVRIHTGRMFFWRMADQIEDLIVVLDWLGTISGRVIDRNGKTQPKVDIGLYAYSKKTPEQMYAHWKQKRTDTKGFFTFNDKFESYSNRFVVNNTDVAERQKKIDIGTLAPDKRYNTGDIVWINKQLEK